MVGEEEWDPAAAGVILPVRGGGGAAPRFGGVHADGLPIKPGVEPG